MKALKYFLFALAIMDYVDSIMSHVLKSTKSLNSGLYDTG